MMTSPEPSSMGRAPLGGLHAWRPARRRPLAVALLAGGLMSALCGHAAAQTSFSVSGIAAAPSGSGGCASFSDISASLAQGAAAGGPCSASVVNIGSVAATASAGGLGAEATLQHFCCSTAASSGATARADTTLRITGPAGPVPVSLNLVLGALGGPGARVTVRAQQFGSGSATAALNGTVSTSNLGVPIPSLDCNPCAITTGTVNLNTNTDLFFRLQLETQVQSGTGSYTGEVDALSGGGLRFPTSGPVFNLPAGYSAQMPGLGVVDNQWVSPVPEPHTWALFTLGLLGVAAGRQRQRRHTRHQTSRLD